MEARKISVKLRRDPRETAERHSQANPLTLECTLATGESVTETMELRAELHAAQTPATTPLAATATVNMTSGSTGPWDLEFSGAQMNQTVLPDSSTDFWLVIYATDADDNLFTLAKIGLTLTFDNVSQVTPPPPEPPLYATFAFRTFAVAGQSSVVAETTADTLTLVAPLPDVGAVTFTVQLLVVPTRVWLLATKVPLTTLMSASVKVVALMASLKFSV
jgi:hypothetical protein